MIYTAEKVFIPHILGLGGRTIEDAFNITIVFIISILHIYS